MRVFAITLLALAVPAIAHASPNPWIAIDGSWGSYAMSDVNDDIKSVNDLLAGSGLKMDEIHGGVGVGGRFGLDVTGHWSVGIGYERLFASSKVEDPSGRIEYRFPANAFRAFGDYVVYRSNLHLGIGAGLVSASGSVEFEDKSSPPAVHVDVTGSGPLIEGSLGGEYWVVRPKFALLGSAGVRYARIEKVEGDGQTVTNADGSNYTIDYSGVLLRVGMKLAFLR